MLGNHTYHDVTVVYSTSILIMIRLRRVSQTLMVTYTYVSRSFICFKWNICVYL